MTKKSFVLWFISAAMLIMHFKRYKGHHEALDDGQRSLRQLAAKSHLENRAQKKKAGRPKRAVAILPMGKHYAIAPHHNMKRQQTLELCPKPISSISTSSFILLCD